MTRSVSANWLGAPPSCAQARVGANSRCLARVAEMPGLGLRRPDVAVTRSLSWFRRRSPKLLLRLRSVTLACRLARMWPTRSINPVVRLQSLYCGQKFPNAVDRRVHIAKLAAR